MNMQYNLIWELILYEFEMGHDAVESTKNIFCVKSEGAVDHSTVTWGFRKFCSGYKNFNNQTRSSRPKIVDSETVFQAIETNPLSSTQRVLGELGIKSSVVGHRHMWYIQ